MEDYVERKKKEEVKIIRLRNVSSLEMIKRNFARKWKKFKWETKETSYDF